jgi:hypothetical protein
MSQWVVFLAGPVVTATADMLQPITGRLLDCRLELSIRLYDFVVPVWLPPKEHDYPQIIASSTDGRSPLASLTLARFWPSYG